MVDGSRDDEDPPSALSPSEELLLDVARRPRASAGDADLIGTSFGRYRVTELLGRGGMGVVYRAWDTMLSRTIALKVLPTTFLENEERRRRFMREARSAAMASAKSIATVYDVGEIDGRPYLAMELVEGRTFRARLLEGRLSPEEALLVARKIAEGLAAAHRAGVIHRDLKPENVMLDAHGDPKILDFGLAKLFAETELEGGESATVDGKILGTPAYMSPEQAKGLPVDARTDVFSFGVMLYEMLAGKRPFAGRTTVELLIAIDRDVPSPIPGLSPALEALVSRCLSKDPSARPADGAALLADVVNVEQLSTSTALAIEPRARTSLRAVIGLLLVAAIAGISLTVARVRRANTTPQAPVAPASPLVRDDTRVACPVLAVEGVPEPNGWLGAAAASRACRRLLVALGGRSARVLLPASLLDLPHAPTTDFPRDPFDAAGVWARTLQTAKERGDAILDGKVSKLGSRLRVELTLRAKDDRVVATASGEHETLLRAVVDATDGLLGPHAVPLRNAFPELEAAGATSDPRAALALADVNEAWDAQDELSWAAARTAPFRGLPELEPLFLATEASLQQIARPRFNGSPDVSSPRTLILAAAALSNSTTSRETLEAFAAALAKQRALETRPAVRSAYAMTEATMMLSLGRSRAVAELLLPLAEDDPIAFPWFTLALGGIGNPNAGTYARAFEAWQPESVNAHLNVSKIPGASPEVRLRATSRGWLLSPTSGDSAIGYVTSLLAVSRVEEARAIGARLLGSPEPRLRWVGAAGVAGAEIHDGRIAAAARRVDAVMDEIVTYGGDAYATRAVMGPWMDTHFAIGDLDAALIRVLDKFFDPKKPHAVLTTPTVGELLDACTRASAAVALTCATRVRAVLESGIGVQDVTDIVRVHLRGLERFAAGDFRAAAEAWRPLVELRGAKRQLPVSVFDAAGDRELANKIEEQVVAEAPTPHFASWLCPALAKRALARGDRARARLLAQRVIDAFGAVDVTIPVVAEMRAILAKA